MAFTHSINHAYSAGGRSVPQRVTREDSAEISIDEVIAADASDYAVDLVVDVDQIAMEVARVVDAEEAKTVSDGRSPSWLVRANR